MVRQEVRQFRAVEDARDFRVQFIIGLDNRLEVSGNLFALCNTRLGGCEVRDHFAGQVGIGPLDGDQGIAERFEFALTVTYEFVRIGSWVIAAVEKLLCVSTRHDFAVWYNVGYL